MRISTTILGILSLLLGGVCIYAGLGGYIDMRMVIICTLVVLAAVIFAAALIPQKRKVPQQPVESDNSPDPTASFETTL